MSTTQSERASRPMVELRGVSKHFGRVAALREMCLDVYRGEFLTLLGPSGSGKTTLSERHRRDAVSDDGRGLDRRVAT